MLSRTFIAGQKSMPGFKTSEHRLTLSLGTKAAVDFKLKPMLNLKILWPLRTILNPPYLCSINGTANPWWQHICLQHGLLNILSLVVIYCSGKKDPFQKLKCLDNALGYWRALMEMDQKIYVLMPADTASILQCIYQGVISTFKSNYLSYIYIFKAIAVIVIPLMDPGKVNQNFLERIHHYRCWRTVENIYDSWKVVKILALLWYRWPYLQNRNRLMDIEKTK